MVKNEGPTSFLLQGLLPEGSAGTYPGELIANDGSLNSKPHDFRVDVLPPRDILNDSFVVAPSTFTPHEQRKLNCALQTLLDLTRIRAKHVDAALSQYDFSPGGNFGDGGVTFRRNLEKLSGLLERMNLFLRDHGSNA